MGTDYSVVRKVLRDCFRTDRVDVPKTKVVTLAHDNDRHLLYQGRYYSPLIDTIEDDLRSRGVNCLSVARIVSSIKGDIAYANVVSPEGAFARALITKRLKGIVIRNRYPYSYMEEAVWGNLLDETGARKVIGVLPSRELCVACRKRGVWVADVQHGVIAETHPWYGQRFRAQDSVEQLPHAFHLWDPGSKRVVERWAGPKGLATPVTGNRWVARFIQPAPDDQMVHDLAERYARVLPPAPGKKTILIALSWGEFNIPNGYVADGLQAVIRKTADRYRWLIRLHPNQIKGFASHEFPRFLKYFQENLEGCAEWDAPTRYPLPLVLQGVDLHISWMSSVCIEAAQMGIRSALLNPRLRDPGQIGDYYEYYRGVGMVDLVVETEDAIREWIDRNLDTRAVPESYHAFDEQYRNLLSFLAE
jgi:hypothetical protein